MQVKMYVNSHLIETVEVPGPGYSPQLLLDELSKHYAIKLNDQIQFVPVHTNIESDTE